MEDVFKKKVKKGLGLSSPFCYIYSMINNNIKKQQLKFWLGKGCINYIINWNANLNCFGNKIK